MKPAKRLTIRQRGIRLDYVSVISRASPRLSSKILPSVWDSLIAAGLFERADDGGYILTAKGRRYEAAGRIPHISTYTERLADTRGEEK